MERYGFALDTAKPIDAFNSKHFYISPILRIIEEHVKVMQIACMHLTKDGLIGGHKAAGPQMLIVVEGTGWVKGGDRVPFPISKGQIALWEEGEWHETGTKEGMTAINIESNQIKPLKTLQRL